MKVISDSTAIIHFENHRNKMLKVFKEIGATEFYTTRINYIEILAGATKPAKQRVRKRLHNFTVLEFSEKAIIAANSMAMKYTTDKKHRKDFLIAAIAISNKLPLISANISEFNNIKELNFKPYTI
ncbi:MAG: type II toxin-antitoxin system VapC family toxin [Bacteroidetes bacterium]|nr:type II toxin-antitoxin system VapC family toxin [Bacteroidota bacterium]